MAFSYTSPLDGGHHEIRFLVGDVYSDTPLLTDEEILYQLAMSGDTFETAARCCEAIAARLGQESDLSIPGQMQAKLSQRRQAFLEHAQSLRARAVFAAMPYAGGISVADKLGVSRDTDRMRSPFYRNQDAYPGIQTSSGASVWSREEVEP